MSDFIISYKKLISLEGYYLSDEDGDTYCGIARKFHPDCAIWPLVDKEKPLKRNRKLKNPSADGIVQVFYYQNYWQDHFFSNINSQKVCDFIFCQYVNGGYHSIEVAQESVSKKIVVDGIFGTDTLMAINDTEPEELISNMSKIWIQRYKDIATINPKKKKDLTGWINRINILSCHHQ